MTDLETLLLLQIRDAGLPEPKTQYKFHGTRKWKADVCFPCERIICEVDGAIGAFKQRYGYEPTEGWRVGNVLYVKVEVRE